MSRRLSKSATFASLPPPWPEDRRPQIHAAVAARREHKVIVIDDDPTGTQTVYDVPVLTGWEVETLRAEFNSDEACFYVLTNSRSLSPEAARALTLELAKNLRAAAGSRTFTLVSRSDSTLRGHFPLETDALAEVLGPFDATLLIPYFEDGGRYTIDDTHYIAEGDTLIPIAETAFACDAVFGYRSSHLPAYVEEKSGRRIKARDVQSISLTDVRRGGPDAVTARLLALPRGSVAIINAAAPGDLDVFVVGLLAAEMDGGRFCFRTAAQFPAARLGLEQRPLLTARALELTSVPIKRASGIPTSRESSPPTAIVPSGETHRKPVAIAKAEVEAEREHASVALPNAGGLIMVGSHVPATTKQLAKLTDVDGLLQIELRVDQLLTARRREHLAHVSATIAKALASGQDVMVFTSRRFFGGETPARSLQIGSRISDALVELVRSLEVRPRFIVAKGGITCSDLATRALGVKRAIVLGQILPGVPVWRLGLETKFPAMTYVVFPGNVGGPDALAQALQILNAREIHELQIEPSHPMKIAILGAGAMGSAIGALLHKAGHQVTLVDVSLPVINAIQSRGLIIQNKAGEQETVPIAITHQPTSVGVVDLLLVFVKCYHTEGAVKSALPIIGPNTTVLSLQNGWGNGPRIAGIVGKERVVLGVCYHSATVLAPGHVLHAGQGKTFMGELDGSDSPRLQQIVKTFNAAGIAVEPSGQVLKEIWSKLALNVATLPTSSTVRVTADHLLDTPEMQELMKGLLQEVVAVANAQNIPLDFNERWEAITGLLRKLAPNTKGSMLQDVEARRQTEIDVMCGAIIEAGTRLNIPTPYNRAMIGLIKALEASYGGSA